MWVSQEISPEQGLFSQKEKHSLNQDDIRVDWSSVELNNLSKKKGSLKSIPQILIDLPYCLLLKTNLYNITRHRFSFLDYTAGIVYWLSLWQNSNYFVILKIGCIPCPYPKILWLTLRKCRNTVKDILNKNSMLRLTSKTKQSLWKLITWILGSRTIERIARPLIIKYTL